jgi:hypothetical protein
MCVYIYIYIYTMEYCSSTKNNEIMLSAGKWMELKNMLSEKLARLKISKVACFPSYVEARHTNMCTYMCVSGSV